MFWHVLSRCNYDIGSKSNEDGTVSVQPVATFESLKDLVGYLGDYENGWKVVQSFEDRPEIVMMEGPEKEEAVESVEAQLSTAEEEAINKLYKFDRLQMNVSCCHLIVFVGASKDEARLTKEQYRSI